jgi:predicted DNA-binding transcriptional regulator AlpA
MQSPRWVPRKAVLKRYNISDSTLNRWTKRRVFPAPQTIGVNTQRWDENVLDDYDQDPEAWKARHSENAA